MPKLQVYDDKDQLVGHVNARPVSSGYGMMRLFIKENPVPSFTPGGFDDDGLIPDYTGPTVTTIDLPFARLSRRIDNYQLNLAGGEAEAREALMVFCKTWNIPDDAERMQDTMRDEIIFTWKVLKISKGQHEQIFDLDVFEPAAYGAPDYEARMHELHAGLSV